MGIIQTGPGSPLTIAGGSGGKVYKYNAIDTTPQGVLPANTARQSIVFHNPGTIDIFICPTSGYADVNAVSRTSFTPTTSALGGCFRVYGNGGSLTITGECQLAWQAFSASGSGNPLTVMESNV